MEQIAATTEFPKTARGPRPPALVCSKCDITIVEHFDNPLLAFFKKHGRFADEPTGGFAVCDACDAKPKVSTLSPPIFLDCPIQFWDATLTTYAVDAQNRQAVEAARLWIDAGRNAGKDLFLYGPPGTGKSRLAISLARACNKDTRYVRVPALLRKIKDGFSTDEGFPIEPFVTVPLLILDDLGAEKPTAFSMQTLETLYTERLDANRRTILTSNLPIGPTKGYAKALVEQLNDARFLSRLVGSTEVIELAGADRRLR